jgi:hypothetical protein
MGALARKQMINYEHNYRADRSYHDTRQVHAGDSDETKFGENRVSDDGPDDAQDDIPHQPFPGTIHDFAADETRYEPDDQPRQNAHEPPL